MEVYGEDKPSNLEAIRNEKIQKKKIALEAEFDTYEKKMNSILFFFQIIKYL